MRSSLGFATKQNLTGRQRLVLSHKRNQIQVTLVEREHERDIQRGIVHSTGHVEATDPFTESIPFQL